MRSFFSRYKGIIFGVVIVLLLILAVLTKIGFNPTKNPPTPTQKPIDSCASLTKNEDKLNCEKTKNRDTAITTQKPAPTTQSDPSCTSFTTVSGEISCQEAKKIVLDKYPGTINAVSKQEVQKRAAWLIQIESNTSPVTARIAIDVKTKEIFLNSLQK